MEKLHRVRKKWTDSIVAVTLSNLSNFSQFLAWIILKFRVTEKLWKSPINTCMTPRNNDVIVTSLKNTIFVRKEFIIHSASIVASEFAVFKSSWLQCVGILQEKAYNRRVTDLDDLKHRIRSEWTQLDHAVIAAAVHQWCRRQSRRRSFRTLFLISTLLLQR